MWLKQTMMEDRDRAHRKVRCSEVSRSLHIQPGAGRMSFEPWKRRQRLHWRKNHEGKEDNDMNRQEACEFHSHHNRGSECFEHCPSDHRGRADARRAWTLMPPPGWRSMLRPRSAFWCSCSCILMYATARRNSMKPVDCILDEEPLS